MRVWNIMKVKSSNNKIIMWSILVVIGIIGTIVSSQIIPITPILIILGAIIAILGFIIYESYQGVSYQTYASLTLLFIGFTFAWMILWFLFLCYFRYSTYMLTVYL